jgi:hypothetical protein
MSLGDPLSPAVRSLVLFSVVHALLCAVVFLALAGFFDAWDGRAVSVREAKLDQQVFQVLIVEPVPSGETIRREEQWPAVAIEGLDLPIDRLALPMPDPFLDRPATRKQRFQLGFTVTPSGGGTRWVPTSSPQSLAVAVLVFVLGVGLRNMVVAGSPIAITPRAPAPPGPSTPAPPGDAAPEPTRASRSHQGPPPQKHRRGAGRRR